MNTVSTWWYNNYIYAWNVCKFDDLQVLQLLEGLASVYVFASPGCKKWDTCAPEAILTAAGGKLTDILGNNYKYGASESRPNKTGVLAAVNDELHDYALNRIPQELKEKLANK